MNDFISMLKRIPTDSLISKLSELSILMFNEKTVAKQLKVPSIYHSVEVNYREDFWVLFDHYKLNRTISETAIGKVLENPHGTIIHVLSHKTIVDSYSRLLTAYLCNHPEFATLIIGEYLSDRDDSKKLHFPMTFGPKEKVALVDRYLELPNANPNYLKLIGQSQSNKDLPLDDHIILKARKLHQQFLSGNMANSAVDFHYYVSIQDIERDFSVSSDDNTFRIVYNEKWFNENMDYPTLLNNFIYLFGFVDEQFFLHVLHCLCPLFRT